MEGWGFEYKESWIMGRYKRRDQLDPVAAQFLEPEVVSEEEVVEKSVGYSDGVKRNLPVPGDFGMELTKKDKYLGKEYHPSYCDRVIDCMAQGMMIGEMCREIGVSSELLRKWAREYPDFREALAIGEDLAKAWWEEYGRVNLANPKMNTRVYMFFMQNRFGYKTGATQVSGQINHAHAHALLGGTDDPKQKQINDVREENAKCAQVLDILLNVGALQPLDEEAADSEDQ